MPFFRSLLSCNSIFSIRCEEKQVKVFTLIIINFFSLVPLQIRYHCFNAAIDSIHSWIFSDLSIPFYPCQFSTHGCSNQLLSFETTTSRTTDRLLSNTVYKRKLWLIELYFPLNAKLEMRRIKVKYVKFKLLII